jgi:hypothetical protein
VPATVRFTAYGRPALLACARAVRELQGDDPLAPVTVVCARSSVALATRRRLASGIDGRGGLANVTFTTLPRVAERLAAAALARTRRPLTPLVLEAAVRAELAGGAHPLFEAVRHHPATVRALARDVQELRACRPAVLDQLAARGDRPRAVVGLARAVGERLGGWYDELDVLDTAAGALRSGAPVPGDLGGVVVHLPRAVSPAQERFLVALCRERPARVVLGLVGEDDPDEEARRLGDALAADAPGAPGPPAPVAATEVLSAPTADAEVLWVLRRMADFEAEGVPFDRMAVLDAGLAPYPRLVRQSLSQAGIPFHAAGVRPLSATVPGRILLGFLALTEEWGRDEFVAWLSGAPLYFKGRWIPATAWDRISRQAGVVRGPAQWTERLTRYHQELSRAPVDREESEGQARWREREIRQLERLLEFVAWLRGQAEHTPGDWEGWAKWGTGFLRELTRAGPDWPADEVAADDAVTERLDSLTLLNTPELSAAAPGPSEFRAVLSVELSAPAPSASRFGRGVFVGPLSAAVGQDFEVVFVLGMVDGAFPIRRSEDALLNEDDRASTGGELPARGGAAAEARRDFLAVLAGAGARLLSFPRGDQRQGRDQRPSSWWLESLAALEGAGRRLYASDLGRLGPVPGYEAPPSYRAVAARAGPAASLADWDTRCLLQVGEQGGIPRTHFLRRLDPGLDRGVDALVSRLGRTFTPFDGLVAAGAPSPVGGRPVSPTSLERYAACPRRYLLGTVLHLSVPERPEDVTRMSARDKGNAVHEILERFVTGAREGGDLPGPGAAWSEGARRRLFEVADEVLHEYHDRGLTGRPVLWAFDRDTILREVARFADEDDQLRASYRTAPEAVEVRFGATSGRPVTLRLSDGRAMDFRGFIDRVDRGAGGETVVIDYKTGRKVTEEQHQVALARGLSQQLWVYGLAAQQLYGVTDVTALLWFVSEKGDFERRVMELGRDLPAALGEVVEPILAGIEGGVFPAHPGAPTTRGVRTTFDNCAYCDFDGICGPARGREWARKSADEHLAGYLALSEAE